MSDDQNNSQSSHEPRYTFWNLFIVVLPLIVFIGLVAFLCIRAARWNAYVERVAKEDEATMDQVVKDVEAVRMKLGRVPKDQAELEQHLGKPLPEVHPSGYAVKVFYFRKSDSSYILYFPVDLYQDRYYDSDNAKAGWLLRSD